MENDMIEYLTGKIAGDNPPQLLIDMYNKRTGEHIDRVGENLKKVAYHTDYEGLFDRAGDHDLSKYGEVERIPYIWLTEFYRCKNSDQSFKYPEGMEERVEKASNHHVTTNSHHPEAHKRIEDMPELDIVEMVCDWAAMAQELGEGSAKGWADKNVGTEWKFTDEQKVLIYEIIDIIDS